MNDTVFNVGYIAAKIPVAAVVADADRRLHHGHSIRLVLPVFPRCWHDGRIFVSDALAN
ncbi:hypothetical protein [Cerasicoccus fimbriatus]|uniref:hypothetical protein n=1 Tax=Cerasicoccus fimbriatus TaxID=3014554 RepID=UPI0022B514FA|nr:hypothetical protein [Cerasicoccus sp. TK19100]